MCFTTQKSNQNKMKKSTLIIVLIFIGLLTVFVESDTANSNAFSPPSGYTGGDGESSCGTSSCHNAADNIGVGSLSILVGNSLDTVLQESSNTVTVSIKGDNGRNKYGFEIIAKDSTGESIGSMSIINSASTRLLTSGNKTYVSHKSATADSSWSFTWTAPTNYNGEVRFYAAGNASTSYNSNNSIYVASKVIYVKSIADVFIEDEQKIDLNLNVYPSLSNGEFTIELSVLRASSVSYAIFDISGRKIDSKDFGTVRSSIKSPVSISNAGIYIVRVLVDDQEEIRKVIVE